MYHIVIEATELHPNEWFSKEVSYHLISGAVFSGNMTSLHAVWYEKYWMFMCCVQLLLDLCPFFSSCMELWLSWWIMLALIGYSCSSRKQHTHRIDDIMKSHCFSFSGACCVVFFCLSVDPIIMPLPNVIHNPKWLCMSLCSKDPIYEPVILVKMGCFHGKN